MIDLLPSDDPGVLRVLQHLRTPPEDEPEIEWPGEIIFVDAFSPTTIYRSSCAFRQAILDSLEGGETPMAIIVQLSSTGFWPSRNFGHPPLFYFFHQIACYYKIPVFGVITAPHPQYEPFSHSEGLLSQYGFTCLENAYSYALVELALTIHRAFEVHFDPNVLATALHLHYKQTEYPPCGWQFGPGGLVRRDH